MFLKGKQFSTNADGKVSFEIIRHVTLLPYVEGKRYTAKTDSTGSKLEIKQIKFNAKLPFIAKAGEHIGRHGTVEYVSLAAVASLL